MKKIIQYVLAIIIVVAIGGYYYVFIYAKNHHRNIQTETAISITADSLSAQFQADEKKANSLYLNKAIIVKGTVLSVEKNQQGQVMIMLGNAGAFSNVSVTMAANTTAPIITVGETVTIKGVCTGALSDVVITDGAIIN
jgi:DNA/RNA endonuclease YhcR with UshA esterase domain